MTYNKKIKSFTAAHSDALKSARRLFMRKGRNE